MGLLDDIAHGVIVGVGVDGARHGASEAARTVSDRATDAGEQEGIFIDGPPPSPLWSGYVHKLTEAGLIERDQATVIATLLAARDTELQQIIDELRNDSPITRSRAIYGAAGDAAKVVELPDLPDNGQQWTLDTITAWTDPGAGGDVLVQIGGQLNGMSGNAFPIAARFSAPRADVALKSFKLPARENDAMLVQFIAGAGGAAGDRAVIVFNYKRG